MSHNLFIFVFCICWKKQVFFIFCVLFCSVLYFVFDCYVNHLLLLHLLEKKKEDFMVSMVFFAFGFLFCSLGLVFNCYVNDNLGFLWFSSLLVLFCFSFFFFVCANISLSFSSVDLILFAIFSSTGIQFCAFDSSLKRFQR